MRFQHQFQKPLLHLFTLEREHFIFIIVFSHFSVADR